MINLMHAEFYKLRKSMTFKISLLATTLCAVILAVLSNGAALGKFSISANSASGLSDVFIISVIGSLVAGMIICGDFENKNIHDEISCGRLSIVISKAITYCIIITILVLPYAIVGMAGFISQGSFSPEFNFSTYAVLMSNMQHLDIGANIGKALVVTIISLILQAARLSICIPIAFKVRKPVVVTVIGIVFLFVVDLNIEVLRKIPGLDKLVDYLPYGKQALTMDMSNTELIKILISCLVFITIMIAITYAQFKKTDIK